MGAIYGSLVFVKISDFHWHKGWNKDLYFPSIVCFLQSVRVVHYESIFVNIGVTGPRFETDLKKQPKWFVGMALAVSPPLVSVQSQLVR